MITVKMPHTRMLWRKSSYSQGEANCVEVASQSASGPLWRKSSHSNGQAECVEVVGGRRVAVRDSKDSGGPALAFSPAGWKAFTRRVKNAR